MDYYKYTLLTIILILFLSCKNELPLVLIGSEVINMNPRTEEKYSTSNNWIIAISKDSIEFNYLRTGCMFLPAKKSKHKLIEKENKNHYIVIDQDTLELNINYRRNSFYSYSIDKTEFRYFPAVNKKLNIEYKYIAKALAGESYQFRLKNKLTTISFLENEEYIETQKKGNNKIIKRGRWDIRKSGHFYFLIINDLDKIWKFQITDINNLNLKIYDLNSSKYKEIIMSKIRKDGFLHKKKFWASKRLKNPPFAEYLPITSNSRSKAWLHNNDEFIIHNATIIYDLDKTSNPTSVYIDWACNVILVDYNLSFGFKTIKDKITLYPIDKNGELIIRDSKIYYFK